MQALDIMLHGEMPELSSRCYRRGGLRAPALIQVSSRNILNAVCISIERRIETEKEMRTEKVYLREELMSLSLRSEDGPKRILLNPNT
jgi:hypothetical protein